MKNISVLPPEIKVKRLSQRKIKKYLLGSSLVILFFFSIFVGLAIAVAGPRTEIKKTRDQIQEVNRQVASLEKYQEMQKEIDSFEELVKSSLGTPPEWVSFFEYLGKHIPGEVWLTELNASYNNQGGHFTLNGYGYSHSLVAAWLKELNFSSHLSEVRCQYSTEADFRGRKVVQFEIYGELLPGEPYIFPQGGM
ncbi:MAG: PilN domain-containing protein [Candidatus Contubernalis sp.]|nr:PilN domain-containing protein [Candidatus Contubernalis sp.]